ncbi:MAG: twin-arginine translocase subunit TatC [Pseudomonadota bacterium]
MFTDIDDTQAPLIDHLIELRRRLIYALLGLVIACLFGFLVAEPVYNFLIAPLENTYASWRTSEIAELKAENPTLTQEEIEEQVPDFELVNLNVIEPFITKLKLSLAIGFSISFPLIAAQLYAFVAPGLYRHEKKALLPFLGATPILFTAGAALVYYVVMPLAWRFLLDVGQGFGSVLQQTMASYLSIVIQMILAFGISFQLPVVLVLLGKVGIVSSKGLGKFRKYAIVVIFAFAALVTPPDFISQVVLGLPMLALYELSIFGVRLVERKEDEEEDEKPAEEPQEEPDPFESSDVSDFSDVVNQPKPETPQKSKPDFSGLKERMAGAYKRTQKRPKPKKPPKRP